MSDTEKTEVTKNAQSFSLDLREGVELMCTHIPGKENPYLGIKKGSQFIALAEFLSDDDMQFLYEIFQTRIFVIAANTPE